MVALDSSLQLILPMKKEKSKEFFLPLQVCVDVIPGYTISQVPCGCLLASSRYGYIRIATGPEPGIGGVEGGGGEGRGGLGTTEQFMEHKLCITVSSARGRAQLGYRTGSRILLRIAQLGAELVISKVTDS